MKIAREAIYNSSRITTSFTIYNVTFPLKYIIVYIHSQRHFLVISTYTDFSNPVVKHDT